MTTAQPQPRGEIVQQMDGTYELFPVPTDQDTLHGILTDCLAEWERIRIGLLIPGAVWEIKPSRKPVRGGFLTVDFEEWHLHLCIGEHTSAPPEVAHLRRAARAELYRRLNPDHQPTSWGFRLFNGGGQQQITVLLPNPHLDEHQQYEKQPDWSRLYLWDRLREKYLAQGRDATDRMAAGFWHG